MAQSDIPAQKITPGTVPEGFSPHTERTSTILLPIQDKPFLNPIQEFNRDLSVATIKQWSKVKEREGQARWDKKKEKKNASAKATKEPAAGETTEKSTTADSETTETPKLFRDHYIHPKYNIIEALSATGLRSIRYAKELEGAGLILANDLLPTACVSIQRNIEYNDVHAIPHDFLPDGVTENVGPVARGKGRRKFKRGGVVVNEGDANTLLYSHREETDRVDVVDLDPYGTAAPFIDSAVQATAEGGLLCVTCTDLSVLAGSNYPEKCFANYGGVPIKAEYSHEGALRLALSMISTSAARYGKHIVPMLSLSIDFYLRVFVRVYTSPATVKHTFSKHGIVYVCHFCQSHYEQPFGRVVEKTTAKGKVMESFKFISGPPTGEGCPQCGSSMTVCGPMWLGDLHDKEFVTELIETVEKEKDNYGTFPRMKGMLTNARDEVTAPFYFTPTRLASFFHCVSPPLIDFVSALLNGGWEVSRSHASAGSIKTNAPNVFIHDVFRAWIEKNPVREDKIAPASPALKLVQKPKTYEIDFKPHPELSKIVDKSKLVRYQVNPTKHWGPGSRPKNAPAAEGAIQSSEDTIMTDPVSTQAPSEQVQELGLAVDPIALSNDNQPETVAAEAVTMDTKRPLEDGEEKDAKKPRIGDEEEAMYNA